MVKRAIEHVLTVSGLSKSHQGRLVLDDLDLTIRSGEILGLVGANGVGKSTLMSILAGAYPADEGEITLRGEPYVVADRADARRRGIGYVPQRLEIDPILTVAQALFRWTSFGGRPHEALRDSAASLLADAGVDVDPDALMGELVRTEQAIVEAVRMLAEDASLVIMDEVAATFNSDEIADLHRITSLLTQRGRSIVYISHRLHEVVKIADRIAVLRGGYVSVELNPRRVTLADIAQEMQEQEPGEAPDRTGHVSTDVALHVRGMRSDHLSGADFDVHRGEVLGLVGPRRGGMADIGAGLAGHHQAHYDQLELFGRPRTIDSPASAAALRIAYLAEQAELVTPRSGDGTPGAPMSGGEAQKLVLSWWLSADQDLVILNQPSRGLDPGARGRLFEALAAHTGSGRSAILISTEIDELLGWCDRVGFMREGRVEAIVATTDLDAERVESGMRELQPDPS